MPGPGKLPEIPPAVLVIILALIAAVGYSKGYFDFGNFNVGQSIYAGTYSGTFNYEYQKNGEGPWIPGSLDLTFTLKDVNAVGGRQLMAVTYAKCSDPNFGAVGGVMPSGSLSSAEFKANPSSTGERLSDIDEAVIIRFPNTAYIEFPANAGGNLASKFLISADGKTMHSSSDHPDDAWYAVDGAAPFKGYTAPGTDFYDVHYQSWSLTKTSS